MVSIAVHGGRTPHDGLRDAVDWGRVVVATAARAVIATLLGLALWSAAPALLGWHPTTVMTGSMEPRLAPGDVVVSRPVTPLEIRLGQILLADDPDRAGHLRMHRFVDPGRDGTIVTKGDANPQADSTPIERSAVLGVASLRIPFVATPVLWVREGRWAETAMLALAVAAVLALCTVDGGLRRSGAHRANGRGGGPAGTDGAGAGREARDGAATRLPSAAAPDPSRRSLRRAGLRRAHARRSGAAALVVLALAGTVALAPNHAQAAPFGRTTGTAVGLTAATVPAPTALTCADSSGSVVIGWSYSGDLPKSFTVADNTGAVLATTADGRARTATVRLSGALALGTTRTVRVQTTDTTLWTSVTSAPVTIQYTSILGLGAGTTCVP